MTADLVLPGTIPGLLRRGSPVCTLVGPGDLIVGFSDRLTPHRGEGAYLASGSWVRLVGASLDLTDATGRAHAAWWLARTLYPDEVHVSAAVVPGRPAWGERPLALRHLGPHCRATHDFGLSTLSVLDGVKWRGGHVADACSFLDAHQPDLLPDGSRWVDAEALRRAVLAAANLPLDGVPR
jgi:hypothetical protein